MSDPGQAPALAVIGLGYVGLPLAQGASLAGLHVIGLDSAATVVDGLNSGHSHVDDLADADIAIMLSRGFRATTDPAALREADTIVICVPTPLSDDGGPDLGAVESAGRTVAQNLRPGRLVILESTTYPGTTEEVLIPILETSGLTAGVDFNCAFSPERIDPGNQEFDLSNTPKVVGGLTPECSARAAAFYGQFVDTVVTAKGLREAEMTKLLENTYRHINIALVNEMSRFCHELGIDLWDAIRCASTKPFGFQPFYPGPGVGGHCIPIDPNYLSYRVRTHLGQPFRFVELAQEINSGMPPYVARRAQDLLNDQGLAARGARIALLGVTYKPNISDQRESPAVDVATALLSLGAQVSYFDPHVTAWNVDGTSIDSHPDLASALEGSDLVILLQAHRAFDTSAMSASPAPLLDTRGLLSGPNIHPM